MVAVAAEKAAEEAEAVMGAAVTATAAAGSAAAATAEAARRWQDFRTSRNAALPLYRII